MAPGLFMVPFYSGKFVLSVFKRSVSRIDLIKSGNGLKIDLFLSRSEIQQDKLPGRMAVVIDVFRASSSIITALGNGCNGIIPVTEVEEARNLARNYAAQSILLAGEQNEMPIPGFDLSNSPLEYTEDHVQNKKIIFTSTNGAQLFSYTHAAQTIAVGGFLNITKLSRFIIESGLDVAILCAGKSGYFGLEDAVCGGMIINKIFNKRMDAIILNDSAVAAHILYQHYADDITGKLYQTSHGKRLIEIGQEKDLIACSAIDSSQIIPILKGNELVPFGE